jgi:hypothetical protein
MPAFNDPRPRPEHAPMKSSALLALGLLLGASAPALAAATPEEAQRLTALFQSYLSADPGVVTVTPSGSSYAARFDLAPLIARLQVPGLTASVTPIEWTITPQGAGKWQVDQDQPLSMAAKVDGQFDVKAQLGAVTGTGIFDEALGTFASTSTEYRQIAIEQTVTEQNQTARSSYTIASVKVQSANTGMGGNVDGGQTQSYLGFRQTTSLPAAPDGSSPAMDFTLSSPEGQQEVTYSGLKVQALNSLLAWAVAHNSEQAIIAGQAELKDKLRAAMPVFSQISGETTMKDVNLNSIAGSFSVRELGIAAEMNGIVAQGRFRETISLSGFRVPAELLPQWAAGLVPENLRIDVNLSDFNLAAPAAMMIDRFDLSKDPPLPQELDNELLAALLPGGSLTIGLGPSEILAALYHLTAEGSMTAGPVAMPQGKGVVKLKGLDETMAVLQAAPAEMGMQQVTPLLLLVKGLGKQGPDGYLSWSIESTPEGSVTVNGTDITKMMGGP